MGNANLRYAWLDRKVVPWSEAKIHVHTEAIMHAATLFEGLRAYWNTEQEQLYLFRMPEHMRRLEQSMKMMRVTLPYSVEIISRAMVELLTLNEVREDVHLRATVYLGEGRAFGYLPEEVLCGAFITVAPRPTPRAVREGMSACVSTWRRLSDTMMPPRIKTSGNYLNSRMAVVEARVNGYDNAILLDERGKLAEGPGACVFIIRDDTPITPPVTSSILESITRATLMEILHREMKLITVEREVDRTELYVAEEAFYCGSLWEVTPITSIDRQPVGNGRIGSITKRVQELYIDLVRGKNSSYGHWLTPVY